MLHSRSGISEEKEDCLENCVVNVDPAVDGFKISFLAKPFSFSFSLIDETSLDFPNKSNLRNGG